MPNANQDQQLDPLAIRLQKNLAVASTLVESPEEQRKKRILKRSLEIAEAADWFECWEQLRLHLVD